MLEAVFFIVEAVVDVPFLGVECCSVIKRCTFLYVRAVCGGSK